MRPDYYSASQITSLTFSNETFAYRGNLNSTGTYVPDNFNRYKEINGQALTYDLNGNLATDNGASYVYDNENSLISTSGIVSASLKYYPNGRNFFKRNITKCVCDR